MVLFLLSLALAQTPAEPPPAEEAVDEEIIVFGAQQEKELRQALEATLLSMGYTPVREREGRTIYRTDAAWEPVVLIDDDGYAVFRYPKVRIVPLIHGERKWRYLTCIPPLTVLCVRLHGLVMNKRRLHNNSGPVAFAIKPALDAWRNAVVKRTMNRRIYEEIPAMLEAIWEAGDAPGEEEPLRTPAQRRAAILGFWAGRTCTPEGAAAREQALGFLNFVVQDSGTPVTAEERAWAEAANLCGEKLELRPAVGEPGSGR